MTGSDSPYVTRPIEPDDVTSGFSCGRHELDDYFARHALLNDRIGIGRAYVLCREETDSAELPRVIGFYTLSMAVAGAAMLADALKQRLPRYPLPVGSRSTSGLRATASARSSSWMPYGGWPMPLI
jgi:hypothetical protein